MFDYMECFSNNIKDDTKKNESTDEYLQASQKNLFQFDHLHRDKP